MFLHFKKQTIVIISFLAILGFGVFLVTSNKKPAPVIPLIIEEKKEEVIKPLMKIIGKSVEGRNIEAYTYGNGATHLAFIGGIHGGYEWNSVILAYTFIDYLKIHPEIIPKNLTVIVIPSANPDGLYKVTGKSGRFAIADVSTDKKVLESGRFNANDVDINRNFDCKWKSKSTWRSKIVSAGTEPFSEPEAKAIRDFILEYHPSAVTFWHSQSNGVYASQCQTGILKETLVAMNTYSKASGYPAIETFDAYEVTGAVEDWLSSINIPAITVELKTHETVEWAQNLAGIKALIEHYNR